MASRQMRRTSGKAGRARRGRAAHLGPERRRPLVLDAALRLFVERGYDGTSMDAIAEAAEVSKPAVYACYPSKAELFRALLDREERRLVEAVGAALPREPRIDDAEGMLAEAFTALLAAAAAASNSWRVVFDAEHGSEPAVARRIRRSRASIVANVAVLVEAYLSHSRVAEAERKAPVLAELLASAGEAGVRVLLTSNGDWTPRELGRLLGRFLARGAEGL